MNIGPTLAGRSGRRPLAYDDSKVIPWLEILPAAEQERAVAALSVMDVPPNKTICRCGVMPHSWIGVVSGLVKMSGLSESGRPVTFAGFPIGGWFGEGTMLKKQPYQYTITSLQRSTLAYLPACEFDHLLQTSLAFNQFLLKQLNERLGQFIAYKAAEKTLTYEARLAEALATLFDPSIYPRGSRVLKISQQELAYLVGTSRQQVNESLRLLKEFGAIRHEYGAIHLLDYERLVLATFRA